MLRVLVSIAVYRIIPQCRESVYKLSVKDGAVDFLYQTWRPRGENDAQLNVFAQRSTSQRLFLQGDYDYLFELCDDIIVPDNALQQLIAADKPIISGIHRLFAYRAGSDHLMCRVMDIDGTQDADDRYLTTAELNTCPLIVEATQCDLGCVLLTKKAVIEIEPDWRDERRFIKSVNAAGYKQYVHTGVRCGHYHEGHGIMEV